MERSRKEEDCEISSRVANMVLVCSCNTDFPNWNVIRKEKAVCHAKFHFFQFFKSLCSVTAIWKVENLAALVYEMTKVPSDLPKFWSFLSSTMYMMKIQILNSIFPPYAYSYIFKYVQTRAHPNATSRLEETRLKRTMEWTRVARVYDNDEHRIKKL
jgi:hypothetical protein